MGKADHSVSVSPLLLGLEALTEGDVVPCFDLSVCYYDCLIPANMYIYMLDQTVPALPLALLCSLSSMDRPR
jgi:hypothetical protein